MNVIRISDRNLVKVNYTVHLSSSEFYDLVSALNCLAVPSPIEDHEEARQLLLSEVSEFKIHRIENLLTQLITTL